jgi:hypothetical protein
MNTPSQSPRRRCRSPKRTGVATIEMVMCFPVLIIMVAMIFTLGTATLSQSEVTMQVRNEAWALRTNPKNQRPFGILQAHSSGQEAVDKTKTFRRYTNLFPQIPRTAQATNVVLTGSWDHRYIDFERSSFLPIYPHFGVLTQMVSQGGINTGGGSVSGLRSLTGIPLR